MKTPNRIVIAILLSIPLWIDSCRKEAAIEFSGIIISNSGKPVAEAQVQVNGATTKSLDDGTFRLFLSGKETDFLVTVRKFGYGLYSNRFQGGFKQRKIFLSQGTVTAFDPSKDIVLTDKNSFKNPFKPALLSLDTAQLFAAVPSVFDGKGNLVDLGYPNGAEGMFDYLRIPITGGPGISVSIPAGSLVDSQNNAPPAGTKIRASLSTVDFFNPDGMPGDAIVRTREGLGYMESFGAGTIEITDGTKSYNLKKGAKAKIVVPIYPIRLKMKEALEEQITLLRYNEKDGVWEETGTGYLNKSRTAYEGEVDRFSVLNMDMVKTGPSKCFKIRQILKQGATDNSAGFESTYRALVVVPATATTPFRENPVPSTISESSVGGCIPVPTSVPLNTTYLHPITRIPTAVPFIAVVFSDPVTPDVLAIAIADASSIGTIPANTAVTTAMNCATNCNAAAPCNPNSPNPDPLELGSAPSSDCNTNTGCFLSNCGFIPFENLNSGLRIVGVPMGTGQVRVKWVNHYTATQSLRITRYSDATCTTVASVVYSRCAADCIGTVCRFGDLTDPTGVATGTTISYRIEAFSDFSCAGGLTLIDDECVTVTVR